MQLDLWTSEWVVCGFFAYLAVLSRIRPLAAAARRRVALVGLVCIALVIMLSRLRPSPSLEVLREWLPAVYLLQGYWLCGVFYRRPMPGIERRLLAVDTWLFGPGALGRLVARTPRIVCSCFELAYLLAYPLVPLGFGAFVALGQRARADDFWTAALIAAFGCYGMLPWIQTRPPRALAMRGPLCSPYPVLRRLNGAVLHRLSVQANTMPSGHAATLRGDWPGGLVGLHGGRRRAALRGGGHHHRHRARPLPLCDRQPVGRARRRPRLVGRLSRAGRVGARGRGYP